MSDVDITCTPSDGILATSADTIAALDLLGITLAQAGHPNWRIDVQLPTALLTARPHTTEPEEATA